jgi:hypothetical protein
MEDCRDEEDNSTAGHFIDLSSAEGIVDVADTPVMHRLKINYLKKL